MTVISIPGASPALRLAWLLLVGLLIVALGSGAALVGSALLTSTRTDDGRRAPPSSPRAARRSSPSARSTTAPTARRPATSTPFAPTGPSCASSPMARSGRRTRLVPGRHAHRLPLLGLEARTVSSSWTPTAANRMTLASSEQSSQDCLARTRLAWAPDASSLIFPTRTSCTGPYDLQIVAADGSIERDTAACTESFDGRFAAWSPDGLHSRFLGRTADEPSVGLYTAATNPSRRHRGNPERSTGPESGHDVAGAVLTAPRWSPMDQRCSWPPAGELSGPTQRPRGGGRWLGTAPDHRGRVNPSWSPDGTSARLPAAGGAVGALR